MPLPALLVYEDAGSHSAALNMAIDEALLEQATTPSLRFYTWRRPAVSFGYFDRHAEVAALAPERELVRRWTGGGIVLHGDDQTYSFILPAAGREKLPPARALYSEIHAAICAALPFAATLATTDAPKISSACFANPVTADVLRDGAKVAGAAQRRTRAGLLHQGSIQVPNLPATFRAAFAAQLCPQFTRAALSESLLARAEEIAAARYATTGWLTLR